MDELNKVSSTSDFIGGVLRERSRQKELGFGGAFDDEYTEWHWSSYISRVAGRSLVKTPSANTDLTVFKQDLIKVAAIALAAYESLERKESK